MNSMQLLAHFEKISEAPDAIPRLRRFVIDLAVRGKLVQQNSMDGTGAELIAALNNSRVKSGINGRIQKERAASANILADEKYLEVPWSWTWARICDLGQTQTGTSPSSANPDLFGDFIPFIKPANLDGKEITYDGPGLSEIGIKHSRLAPAYSVLMVCIGATLGKVNTTTRQVCFNQQINSLTPFMDGLGDYLALTLRASEFQALAWSKAGTGTLPIISKGRWEILPVPIPPLAEQQRIVAKVDELMALCDQLEAARTEREARRDRFASARLGRLKTPDPETFEIDARFTLDALTALTTRADQIRKLRQTILNLAVRGRLVRQDPKDEPASELLMRIAAEKSRLIKAGELKKGEEVSDLTLSRSCPSLPPGWAATDLQSICMSVTDGDHLPPPKADSGIPFLVIGNVRSQRIEFEGSRFVPQSYYDALDPIRRPKAGDLLYTLVGSYGIPVIVQNDRPFCVQRHIGILRPSKLIDLNFLAHAMASEFVLDQATSVATGIAQKTVSLSGLRKIRIDLPPHAEQVRIGGKVNELMALCDQLEASLEAGEEKRHGLLEAILNEALSSGGQSAMRSRP